MTLSKEKKLQRIDSYLYVSSDVICCIFLYHCCATYRFFLFVPNSLAIFDIHKAYIGVISKFRVVFDRFIKEYLLFVFHAKSYLFGIMDAVKCQYNPCKYFYILNLKDK